LVPGDSAPSGAFEIKKQSIRRSEAQAAGNDPSQLKNRDDVAKPIANRRQAWNPPRKIAELIRSARQLVG
jgi:hypothetical protein